MHTIIPGMLREGSGNAMPLGVMGTIPTLWAYTRAVQPC